MSVPNLGNSAPVMKDGFVNILNKILNDQPNAMECELNPILSRAKSQRSTNQLLARHAKRKIQLSERRQKYQKARKKPSVLDMAQERKFQLLATKGVVQLFNAVSKEQKKMDAELKTAKTEAKKSRMISSFDKKGFLDMLMKDSGTKSLESNYPSSDEASESANSFSMESDGEEFSNSD